MVDNAQKVQVEAELDASQTVRGARDASAELIKLLGNVKELERVTRSLFTGQGTLPRELQQLSGMLQQVQQLPAQMAQVQRLARNLQSGGPGAQINAATLRGVQANIRNDPALQQLAIEKDLNKVAEARGEIYRRIRQAMPDDASQIRMLQAYRDTMASLGGKPGGSSGDPARRAWLAQTRLEFERFEKDHTRTAALEAEKRSKEALRIARETNRQELSLAKAHAAELNRLFRQDMAGVMTGATAAERRAAAGESVNRLRDYAGRQGMTGFNEAALMNRYEDAEARRSARDLTRRPTTTRIPLSDDERAARAYQQRDAFMNYNGGANRIGSRFQFAGDFAAVGAVMGTAMYAGRSTVELQKEMKQLQAITKATDQEMKVLQGTIFAVGQTTAYSTKEIAEAATVMGQAGYSAQQIKEALPSIANLATAAGGDLSDTVATVTSVLSIYDMSIDRTANVSNMLAEALNGSKLSFEQLSLGLQYAGNVAADGGVQFEELTAALGAMAQAGIRSGSTLGTGLRALIQELENPSDKFLEWLRSVGLTADDVDVRTQGLAGALSNLTAKSFDSGKAMNVFEIRAASAFSALSNNLDVLDQLQDDMVNTNAATEGAKTQMESITAQTSRLGNAVTEFTTIAGAPLLAFLEGAIGAMASFLTILSDGGPIIQILTTALTILIALQVGKWLMAMTMGFIGMSPAILKAQLGLVALNFQVGGFSAVAGLATQSIRAFTVALIASPIGIFALGLTALVTAFTLQQSAAAATARKIEEYKTKANEAAAESTKFSDRIEELSGFMETLVNRAGSLGSETEYSGKMAETTAAKFASWGLVLEGNITTVGQLTAALATLSRSQAEAALNQKNMELTALEGQRDTLQRSNPWGTVAGTVRGLTTQFSSDLNTARFAAPQADGSAIGALLAPVQPLLDKAVRGTLTKPERDRLAGWLFANKGKFPVSAQSRVQAALNSLNSSAINDLYNIQSQITANRREAGDLTVAASAQNEAAVIRGTSEVQNLRSEQRRIEEIKDPAQRARERAALQERTRTRSGYNDDFIMSLARQTLANNPQLRETYADRSRLTGQPVENLIASQLRRSAPGFGQVDLLGGNLDPMNNIAALKSRERALQAQITDAGTISDPAERDRVRRQAEEERKRIIERRIALENPETDPGALRSMMDDALGRGSSMSNTTQETSEQRAARDRSATLKRQIKTLQDQIEATSINTQSPTGAAGSASEQRALDFFISKGLTPAQAAGIVGNLSHESGGMNTTALGDNGSAYGLAQWRGSRRSALDAFAASSGKPMSDFNTQLEFVWKEMQERGDLGAIQGTNSVAGAAEVFARKFERPRGVDGPLSGLAGWSDRLGRATRLAGGGSTTTTNPQVQALLDQWKSANISQIKAEGEASNISDDEMKQRLADFEQQAQEYFNDVLSGNAAKMKQLLADASLRAADGFAAGETMMLRSGGSLDQSLSDIQTVYLAAAQAAMDASDAEFRAKGSEVDPSIAAEAVEARRKIQDDFASKIVTSTLEAIDSFFAGEAERAETEISRLNLTIERERARISTLSNAYGSKHLSDVQRYLGGMESEKLDARQSGVDLQRAQNKDREARGTVTALEAARNSATTDEGRNTIDAKLVTARENAKQMADELERARYAFSAMNDEAPEFGSFTEALSASWAVFTDQIENSKGTWETVADGLLGTMNVAKEGFSTLVKDIVTGNKTMGDAFKDFTLSILQSLLDLAAEMLAKKLIMWVINVIGGQMGGGTGMDAQGSAMLRGGSQYGGSSWLNSWHGGPINMAAGGLVPGTDSSRDSVPILGMPGEVMMSKSAVDMVGRDTLLALNGRANSRLSAMPSMGATTQREPDMVNVWLVKEEAKPPMGKKDIIAVVSEDIMTGGQTKKLIKAVAVGAA